MNLDKINNINEAVKNGKLLMADPFLFEYNFKRAVILLCEHNDQGSLGFIINKKMEVKINDIMATFPEFDADVYYGGPVATDTVHFIHTKGDLINDSQKLVDGVYWGGDFDELQSLVSMNLIEPKDVRFFVGYSGWSEGQLLNEIKTHTWIIGDLDANYVFKDCDEPNDLWQNALRNKGNIYSVIANISDQTNHN